MSFKKNISIAPLRLFITGRAGVRKSYLMKIIFMSLTKTMNLYLGFPEKPKLVILAPIGVAAININETTINSGFSIPPYVRGYTLARLSDEERVRLSSS